jgi:hypothetical protein
MQTFSASGSISQQQGGYVFNSEFDSALESVQGREGLQMRSFGSSEVSRSVEGELDHAKGSNSSDETLSPHARSSRTSWEDLEDQR